MSTAGTPLNPLAAKIRAAHPGAYDDMDDAELTKRVLAKYPQYSDLAGAGIPKPQVNMETSALGHIAPVAKTAGDVLQGVGEGAFHTVANTGKLITDPLVTRIASPESVRKSNEFISKVSTPENTAQGVGKFGEQVAEIATPTGVEGAIASKLPKLGKLASAGVKVGSEALESGLKNKAQGGDFTTGAAAGAGGELLGMGAQKVAPKIAETALGITGKMRGHGRTIGQAVLDETKGVVPETIAKQAGEKIGSLTGDLERRASAFSVANTASTNPAHAVIDNAIANAPRNARDYTSKLESLKPLLDFNAGAGPQRRAFTPEEILEMKRGVDKEISSWSPEVRKGVEGVKRQIYRALDSELDRTVPGAEGINQRISSLIPAQKRAAAIANNASTTQRIAHRISAHTGAAAGGVAGGYYGYEHGGVPGAIYGSTLGIALPELISSPTGQMTAARVLSKPKPIVKGLRGAALQLNR